MELLYAEGKGVIFEQVLQWIKSSKEHLRASGVLAIGNFARNGMSGVVVYDQSKCSISLLSTIGIIVVDCSR